MPEQPQPLLEPFDDEMLVPSKREEAIIRLRSLRLPSGIAASHLKRWAAYVGVELTPQDYRSVGVGIPRPPRG